MSRVPIRWRLSLAFAVAMALVLSALGAFLYVRLERSLLDGLDETLELRAAQIESPADLGSAGDEGIAQAFDSRGRLLASSPGGEAPILTAGDVERAGQEPFTMQRDGKRVLVRTVDEAVLAVGVTLEDMEDTLGSLLAQLLIVGPLALALASVGGYFMAAAALRPVESMRREAEAVSAVEPGRRLTVPPADDELRRLGETINTMLGRLETALERERRFVADASHELRTPLAMLRTELELALRRERTPEEMGAALRSASDETQRLSRLADDLLVLARSHGGDLPVRREHIAAQELLTGLRERFLQRASEAGRTIEVHADEGSVVFADRLRLEQALGNLVDNALRHGGGSITLGFRRMEGRSEFHVLDEGPGFPEEFRTHAFEPFSRGDAARTGGGAGLGLAIVDVIARAHGGSAHVANASGGADAWIALPVE